MLIILIIGCGIVFGGLLVLRAIRRKKVRIEKKKFMQHRLEHLILTNRKKSQ